MEIWHLNLRHLAAVAEIARLGTVSAAAQRINLTQPAITQALVRLEAQLGIPLFERRHDGMTQTAAAELIVPRIHSALASIGSQHVTMARLRALLALADTGSYVGGGMVSGLSAPSLHRAVSDLSLAIRRNLVRRSGNGVFLTEAGRQMARGFRLAKLELETALSEVDAMKGRETRRIRIGAMPLARARVLPAAITRFLRRHPLVSLSIAEGSRAELVEPLRNGTLDLMIGALREPLHEGDLSQQALFTDVPLVIGRRGHPLSGTTPTPADLARYSWTVPPVGAPLRESFDRYFAYAQLPPPHVPIESGSVMTIRQLLLDSDYLTMLSPAQIAVELEAGWLEIIAPLPARLGRVIGITTRIMWRPTTVQSDFLADLAAVAIE